MRRLLFNVIITFVVAVAVWFALTHVEFSTKMVPVPAAPIAAGDRLTASNIKEVPVQRNALLGVDAVTNPAYLLDSRNPKIATQPLYPGQILAKEDVGAVGSTFGLVAAMKHPDDQIITLPVSAQAALGGDINVGQSVNLYHITVTPQGAPAAEVLPDVPILALHDPNTGSSGSTKTLLITIEVPAVDLEEAASFATLAQQSSGAIIISAPGAIPPLTAPPASAAGKTAATGGTTTVKAG